MKKTLFKHIKIEISMNFQPNLFLLLLLSPFGLYFFDMENWWNFALMLQLSLISLALFIPHYRILAIFFLFLIALSDAQWFLNKNALSSSCPHPEQIEAFSAGALSKQNHYLRLIKVTAFCKDKVFFAGSGKLFLKNISAKSTKKLLFGRKFLLSGMQVKTFPMHSWNIIPDKNFHVVDLSMIESRLQRPPLFDLLQTKIQYYLDIFPAKLMQSLLLGEKRIFSRSWKNRFQELGISHIFAISGMHIGILYLWCALVIRLAISVPSDWIQRGAGIFLADLLSVIFLFAYLYLIGIPISGLRAWSMLTFWLATKHFFPWQSHWFVLFFVGLVILLLQPEAIGQIDFQLSFLSIGGIFLLSPLFPNFSYHDKWQSKIRNTLVSGMGITAWLMLLTLPITSTYFHIVSLGSIVNNLLHIFFLSWIFIPFAFITFFASVANLYLFKGTWDFYFYAMVNIVGKIWEWLLKLNVAGNNPLVINVDIQWSFWTLALYWSLLLIMLKTLLNNRGFSIHKVIPGLKRKNK